MQENFEEMLEKSGQEIDKFFENSEEEIRNLFEWKMDKSKPVKGVIMSELKVVPNVEESSGLLDMTQAAKYLNIKTSTLYSLCMRREIPCVKIGKLNRFRLSDLNKWIESHIQGKA